MGNTLNIAIIRLVREAIHGRGARELSKVIRVRYGGHLGLLIMLSLMRGRSLR